MRGNSFGKLFSLTSFGESHGVAMGVVIDGVPANLEVNINQLKSELDKRRPGRLKVSTSRNEKDTPQILSGIFNNKTLGTPICVLIHNNDQRSQDYEKLKHTIRPGHADQTTLDKYGIRDYRGGGRASGRETVSRVIAGYFASLILPQLECETFITELAEHKLSVHHPEKSHLSLANSDKDQEIEQYLLKLKEKGNSCGGRIQCRIKNIPKSLGEPVFDKLKADLSKSMLSIGSCIGFQLGVDSQLHQKLGQEISKESSNFGGIEGGISNGQDLCFHLSFKAPSTIGDKAKQGRHDPCILPRVIPVIEAMAKITLADHYLRQQAYSF